jgi:uncharacterized phage protein (TIGR02218 family)
MSDAVLDIEASQQDNEPRELVDISHGSTTYRLTFCNRDINDGPVLYTAVPGARSEIGVSASGNGKELTLTLPIDHALVRRYVQQGCPPRTIRVTLRRKYVPSGLIEILWVGSITSMSWDDDGSEATFRIPARSAENLLRVLPNVQVSRTCPHTLYDSMCGVGRNSVLFRRVTNVISVSGRDIRVDIGNTSADGWSNNGELKHTDSGEIMTIREQVYINPPSSSVVNLSLQMPIPELKTGDAVEIYAGCNRSIEQCDARFANRQRFGGLPSLPDKNPFIRPRLGY